jgi:hypothetical protein
MGQRAAREMLMGPLGCKNRKCRAYPQPFSFYPTTEWKFYEKKNRTVFRGGIRFATHTEERT